MNSIFKESKIESNCLKSRSIPITRLLFVLFVLFVFVENDNQNDLKS